jgi:hypothetical protein
MADPFDSAWLKWGWAGIQTRALEADIDAFLGDPKRNTGVEVGKRYDPRRHGIVFYVVDRGRFPDGWGLRLGDVIHSYRSCLDQIAWAVVSRGKQPPSTLTEKQQRRIYFPVYGKRERFNDALRNNLPGIRRADAKAIRLVQPYHYAEASQRSHWLTVVHELSNLDKHRTFQPVSTIPREATFGYRNAQDCIVRDLSRRQRSESLQPGVEIGVFFVRKTGPNPDIEIEGRFAIQPAVNERFPLLSFLDKTRKFTEALLRYFQVPPSDLAERITGIPS